MSSSRRSARRKELRKLDDDFKRRVVGMEEKLVDNELYRHTHPYFGVFDRCVCRLVKEDLPQMHLFVDGKPILIVNLGRVAAFPADAERPTGPQGDEWSMSDCGE